MYSGSVQSFSVPFLWFGFSELVQLGTTGLRHAELRGTLMLTYVSVFGTWMLGGILEQ